MSAISERLKHFAKISCGSVNGLAQALDMSQPNLSQYTTGKYLPSAVMMQKLRAMGCSIDWLLDGEEPMFANNEAGRLLSERAQILQESKREQPKISTNTPRDVQLRDLAQKIYYLTQ